MEYGTGHHGRAGPRQLMMASNFSSHPGRDPAGRERCPTEGAWRRRSTAKPHGQSGQFTGMPNREGILAVCEYLEEHASQAGRDYGSAIGSSRASATGERRSRCSTAKACAWSSCPKPISRHLPRLAITMSGGSPLARVDTFASAACPPAAVRAAPRRTRWTRSWTLWYFLRFTPHEAPPLDPAKVRAWMP